MDEKPLVTSTLLQTQTIVIATTQITHFNISDQVTKKKKKRTQTTTRQEAPTSQPGQDLQEKHSGLTSQLLGLKTEQTLPSLKREAH